MSGKRSNAPEPVVPGSSEESLPFRLLVVEDDPGVGPALVDFFTEYGGEVTLATSGRAALQHLHELPTFDIVLLDVKLPDISGFDVLQRTLEMGITAPVMMVTARGEQEDLLRGYGLGAQDYVVKPFDAEDLLERVKVLLGFAPSPEPEPRGQHRVGIALVDFDSGQVRKGDLTFPLSELEMDLLNFFVRHQGQVITRKRLLRQAWGVNLDHIAFNVSLDVVTVELEKQIDALRKYIERNPLKPKHLQTVLGLGYRYVATEPGRRPMFGSRPG